VLLLLLLLLLALLLQVLCKAAEEKIKALQQQLDRAEVSGPPSYVCNFMLLPVTCPIVADCRGVNAGTRLVALCALREY